MEEKIKELLMKGWFNRDWDMKFIDSCVGVIKQMIEGKRDTFSIALHMYTDWKMNVKYEFLKEIEEIKQQFKQQ